MLRVIISVRKKHESASLDLDLPAEIPMAQLSELVATALGWERNSMDDYKIFAYPQNRQLSPEESLAEADIWDGSELVFTPQQNTSPGISSASDTNAKNNQQSLKLYSDAGLNYNVVDQICILGRSSNTSSADPLIDLSSEPNGKSVSRMHAQLGLSTDGWEISVLHDEHNRTLVNDEDITLQERRLLATNDVITLGAVTLRVEIH